ncbi:DUF1398 family protein, partial [Escherichia coli]|uniref:DUF1398 family protein n=1 Tax=Escherichia coli TaxID=562 RepID=UPI00263B7EEE
MAQVAIFKQIFDKVRNNLNYHWFYSELKRHNVSHYIYYLATENSKRAARTVLTGMCYSVGSATRQGSSS